MGNQIGGTSSHFSADLVHLLECFVQGWSTLCEWPTIMFAGLVVCQRRKTLLQSAPNMDVSVGRVPGIDLIKRADL